MIGPRVSKIKPAVKASVQSMIVNVKGSLTSTSPSELSTSKIIAKFPVNAATPEFY